MSLVKYNDDSFFGPFYTKWPSIFDNEDSIFSQPSGLTLEEDEKSFTARAPVYGVEPDNVKVSVKGNLLTIKGEAEIEEKEKDKKSKKVVYR